ncbi:MAG: hypothetical protein JWO45_1355, partial [Spartobacteria bacterium]|nr:hypothetical protein [Spartobacteria bacterium]
MVPKTIFKCRLNRFAGGNGFHEIGDRMNEGVFVTNDVPWWPPAFHKRMRGLGHKYVPEPLPTFRVA